MNFGIGHEGDRTVVLISTNGQDIGYISPDLESPEIANSWESRIVTIFGNTMRVNYIPSGFSGNVRILKELSGSPGVFKTHLWYEYYIYDRSDEGKLDFYPILKHSIIARPVKPLSPSIECIWYPDN